MEMAGAAAAHTVLLCVHFICSFCLSVFARQNCCRQARIVLMMKWHLLLLLLLLSLPLTVVIHHLCCLLSLPV